MQTTRNDAPPAQPQAEPEPAPDTRVVSTRAFLQLCRAAAAPPPPRLE